MEEDHPEFRAGWYPDYDDPSRLRYFDGQSWTEHVAPPVPPAEPHPTAGAGPAQPAEPHPTAGSGLGPIGYWQFAVFENNSVFRGRARRAEFWWTMFISAIGLWAPGAVATILGASEIALLAVVVVLAVLVPSLAVGVRRLHDTGRSGWWLLIGLIPMAGPIALLVLMLIDGQPGPNKYGPSPKYLGVSA